MTHLGGEKPGGDRASYYPDLWRWFAAGGVSSVLDVGCGEGHALNVFTDLLGASSVLGLDGVPYPEPRIVQHDFTQGAYVSDRDFDLVWSCEFVEHVEERFLPNILETFKLGRQVALTHAQPSQPGWHHVNCRDDSYWIGALAAAGFRLDEVLTDAARLVAAGNQNPSNYFVKTGLVFERYK